MLVGNSEFCDEARIWLRRFGGNIYTLLPSAVSSMDGFEKSFLDEKNMTFEEKKLKLIRVIKALSFDEDVKKIVTFDPDIPSVNMIRGYLRASLDDCNLAIDEVEKQTGIIVLSRIREIPPHTAEKAKGYHTYFEWTMGKSNGSIDDEIFLKGWKEFAKLLSISTKN